MKKNIILITTSLLLSAGTILNFSAHNPSHATDLSPIELGKSKVTSPIFAQDSSTSSVPSTKTSDEQTSSLSDPQGDFLEERMVGESSYPLLTLPEEVPEDINLAISKYFQTQLNEEEQAANTEEIAQTSLDKIKDFIYLDKDLAQLNAAIDQVNFTIGEESVYVPRIIVPLTYSQAEKLAEDNDTHLLNLALTELGNRLVLLAYYNESTDQLLPMHLVNSSHSLFYYDVPTN